MKVRKVKYYLLSLLIIIPFFVCSQTEINTLEHQINTVTDTSKASKLLQLSELYKEKNDYEKAYFYYKEYSDLIDSIQHNNRLLKIQELQKLKLYKNILLIGTILIFILLVLFFYNLRNKIISNRKLSLQNEKIKKKNDQIKSHTIRLSKINRELEKLSIVVSKTDNAIIIANPDGEIDWINEGFTRLYGYTLEELILEKGKTIVEVSSNPNINTIIDETLEKKKSKIYESEVISKIGEKYIAQTTLTPILNDQNEITKLIAIDTDISKQKKVEEELQKLLITKDKFFSIIAHDLKNPFNSLIGIAQLLHHGYDRMSPEKVKHFHKSFYQISKNGYELLVNLLEWSRSQMGKIKFKPEHQNLYAITEETFSLYNAKASQKQIALNNSLSKESFAIADKNMLKTIFRNIISNALKFTERGGAIEVSEKVNNSFTEITIKDTGIGISPENLDKLFKLDESVSTEGTEDESGTGLGLILCKEFTEKHGGKIWIESKVGIGSRFIFTLPLNN